MSRARLVSLMVALAATLALATGAQASQPQPVTITVLTSGSGSDPFSSTGGVICANGTVSDVGGQFVGWQSGKQAQIQVEKQFACADGTFNVLLRVTLDFQTCDTVATWSVLSGTGAYANLRGAGTLTGDRGECGDPILDAYTGGMHIDN